MSAASCPGTNQHSGTWETVCGRNGSDLGNSVLQPRVLLLALGLLQMLRAPCSPRGRVSGSAAGSCWAQASDPELQELHQEGGAAAPPWGTAQEPLREAGLDGLARAWVPDPGVLVLQHSPPPWRGGCQERPWGWSSEGTVVTRWSVPEEASGTRRAPALGSPREPRAALRRR